MVGRVWQGIQEPDSPTQLQKWVVGEPDLVCNRIYHCRPHPHRQEGEDRGLPGDILLARPGWLHRLIQKLDTLHLPSLLPFTLNLLPYLPPTPQLLQSLSSTSHQLAPLTQTSTYTSHLPSLPTFQPTSPPITASHLPFHLFQFSRLCMCHKNYYRSTGKF